MSVCPYRCAAPQVTLLVGKVLVGVQVVVTMRGTVTVEA